MGRDSAALVLVVDVDHVARAEHRRFLEQAGFRTVECDGTDLSRAVQDEAPAVVLLDVAALRAVRANGPRAPWRDVSVVLSSGMPVAPLAALARHVGATGFIRTPMRASKLVAAVRRALQRQTGRSRAA